MIFHTIKKEEPLEPGVYTSFDKEHKVGFGKWDWDDLEKTGFKLKSYDVRAIDNVCDFLEAYQWKALALPEGIEVLPHRCFENCYSLKHIQLPDTLKELDLSVLSSTSITTLNIPKGVESIKIDGHELGSVPTHSHIDEITISDDNKLFYGKNCVINRRNNTVEFVARIINDDGSMLDGAETIGLYAFHAVDFKRQTFTIPDTVVSIDSFAFENCQNIREIVMPEGLQAIGWHVFKNSSIEKVVIPPDIEDIPVATFESCHNLTEVTLGKNTKYIDDGAFAYCENLQKIRFGDNITDISLTAFTGCDNLKEIQVSPAGYENLQKNLSSFFTKYEDKIKISFSKDATLDDILATNCTITEANRILNDKEIEKNYGITFLD